MTTTILQHAAEVKKVPEVESVDVRDSRIVVRMRDGTTRTLSGVADVERFIACAQRPSRDGGAA